MSDTTYTEHLRLQSDMHSKQETLGYIFHAIDSGMMMMVKLGMQQKDIEQFKIETMGMVATLYALMTINLQILDGQGSEHHTELRDKMRTQFTDQVSNIIKTIESVMRNPEGVH